MNYKEKITFLFDLVKEGRIKNNEDMLLFVYETFSSLELALWKSIECRISFEAAVELYKEILNHLEQGQWIFCSNYKVDKELKNDTNL